MLNCCRLFHCPNNSHCELLLFILRKKKKKKDFDQAGHAFQEILENHRTRQTSESFHLEALTLHNIGVVYLLAGDFDKALLNFKEACQMKRINFGHEHPEVSVSLSTGILKL